MLLFNAFLATTAGVIGVVALFAVPLKRYTAPALLALLAGIALGATPVSALITTDTLEILEQASRVSLAVALMAAALRVKRSDLRSLWKSAAVLVAGAMLLMWLFSGLIAYFVFGFGAAAAFLVGAMITPTDPVVAGSLVTGKLAEAWIPKRIRHLITLEAGSNDGLAYLFVLLPALILEYSPAEGVRHWAIYEVFWSILVAAGIGLTIGYVAGRITRWAEHNEKLGETYILIFSTALALFTLAAAKLANTDGILAVFIAGLVFDLSVEDSERASPESVQEAMDLLFTMPAFILLGMALPWSAWGGLGWKAVVFPILIILFRRLPAIPLVARMVPTMNSRKEQLLVGWAGPIGLASIYYSTLITRRLHWDPAWVITSLMVFSSVVVHGLMTPHIVKWLGTKKERE